MLNLQRDLPTTREDVLALRACRLLETPTFEDYLRFLERLSAPTKDLATRPGPRGQTPFVL